MCDVANMKKEFEIAKWIAAAISGKINEKTSLQLEEWQRQSSRNFSLFHKIVKKENIRQAGHQLHKYDKAAAWNNISSQLPLPSKRQSSLLFKGIKYAALFLISAGCWMLYHTGRTTVQPEIVVSIQPSDTIATEGIMLKLANGSLINLKNNQGEIKSKDDEIIATNADGMLSYHHFSNTDPPRLLFNEIYVNRGETYQVELSDGTHVFLNSMSKLKYPSHFEEDKRIVELEGEAYFQVSHDTTRPFIIKAKDFDIQVIGTQFNVNAYPEDYRITTTLVEGSVRMESPKYQVSSILKANEQLRYDKLDRHQILEKVDVSYATAWLENKIRFKDISLAELMTILKRWYDIEVIYESPEIKNLVFGCHINRQESIVQIIEVLEQTGKLKIYRSGKMLIIGQPY